jgi:outer membrane protein assembly factor BamB
MEGLVSQRRRLSAFLFSTAVAGFAIATIALGMSATAAADGPADKYWPNWRGPANTGASATAQPPAAWSEGKNVRWKIAVPGRGAGTPVVWGDRVYISTAVPTDPAAGAAAVHKFVVMAVNRKDGTVAWQQTAREEAPHEGTHQQFGTMASPSIVTDGQMLIASFESRGFFAYDMSGKLLWQQDLGDKRMRNQFGEGTSPALHKDKLYVVWDHQGESFIAALDKKTGREIWKVARQEIDSWATPLVVEAPGGAQVVTGAMNKVRAYDAETGKLVWETGGLTMNPIPSPVSGDGLVFLMSGFRGNNLKAIRYADAKGDITGSPAIAWTLERDTPYVPSPLLYDGVLYFLKGNTAILSAYDAKTGTPHYQASRLDGLTAQVFASPVGAAGRIYVVGQDGAAVVLKHGPALQILATNKLDDRFDASPALVEKELYLRGYKNLYCIAE